MGVIAYGWVKEEMADLWSPTELCASFLSFTRKSKNSMNEVTEGSASSKPLLEHQASHAF